MAHLLTRWNALVVVLAVMTLTGCQGFSSAKSSPQGGQDPQSGALSAAPTTITFGNVQIGTSQSQSGTINNIGTSSVTVSQSAVTGSGLSLTGLTLPMTLSAGQSANFSIVFNPQSTGDISGNLTLTSDATGSPFNVAITGTGVAAGSLITNPTSFSFGSVQVGNNLTQTETLTNSGGESVTVSQVAASGAGFSFTGLSLPLTLAPNQSTTFGVVFTPTTAGAANGSLAVTVSGSAGAIDLALSGNGFTPATLTATPASLSFGNVQSGQTSTQVETIKNTGGANATISSASASGAGFSISGISAPITLTPGQSASFNVIFAPQSSGGFSGSISVVSNASNPILPISLSGTGTTQQAQGQLSVNPSTINVGNVTVGTSGSQTGSLSATGASVSVSSASVGSSEFAISGLAFPVTIAAGQSANFTVTFTPQTSGLASVSASFASNASNSSTAATFTGTGVAAPVHSVNLSWNASTSPNIIGYNIYRSTGSGGSYVQIKVLNAATTFIDSSVVDGQTYFYETTAVNSSNEESARSTPVQAAIPAP